MGTSVTGRSFLKKESSIKYKQFHQLKTEILHERKPNKVDMLKKQERFDVVTLCDKNHVVPHATFPYKRRFLVTAEREREKQKAAEGAV